MIPFLFTLLNIALVGCAIWLLTKKNLLSYLHNGQWWLTWLAIGIITLMDELTSVFYAPSEAFRYIGIQAIIFIPITAVIIHYMTTRMVEIAEILDVYNLKGGGVYNFSYLVLGPVISFVAVGSIMVDYILTAAISSVSAIENVTSFIHLTDATRLFMAIGAIWMVCGINIMGIRENARITFIIFLATAIVMLNLILSGFMDFGSESVATVTGAFNQVSTNFGQHGIAGSGYYFIMALSSCILAYSGVESVLQTAGLVQSWKQVGKAYIFLAVTVGIITPLIAVLVLSHPGINFIEHETDLITHYATVLNGKAFGMSVGILASIILMMAVNTAFVASSELIERVAHRYGFSWVLSTNSKHSLYKIHIANAIFFTLIIIMTSGQQRYLAEMYAVGLVASFLINLVSLLIYRYFKGTKEVYEFNVSRTGTLVFFLIILGCFIYLSWHKPAGFLLWISVTIFSLLVGIYGTKKRAPEIKQITSGENAMDIVFYVAESQEKNIQLYFKRPFDTPQEKAYGLPIFVTFYSARQPIPPKLGDNHFRIPFKRANIHNNIVAILHLLVYELSYKNITVHFGWPTSSWFDRLSTGVMVYQFINLPKHFPTINYKMEWFTDDNPVKK